MNNHTINIKTINSQGVALIMVLVMLLIMSLVSVTAIQQNRLQFAMVGNLQEQSIAFAHAETILDLVEEQINVTRWSTARTGNEPTNRDSYRCKGSGGNYTLIAPGSTIGPTITGSVATIKGWWCQNNPATGDPASCSIGETCPVIPNAGLDIADQVFPKTPAPTTGLNETGCGTELYTIEIQYTQQNQSDAIKTIESKYAVKCLGIE